MVAGEGSTFTASPTAFDLAAAPEGGWIWFTDPRAIHYNGRTYFGFVNGDGDIIVRSVDPATLTVSSETNLAAAFQVDDHAGPSLLVRDSDHRLLVFYAAHDDTNMRLRISTNSLDTDPTLSGGFAAAATLDAQIGGTDYTYPVPIQLTGETNDPIYLFFRNIVTANQYDLVYSKSTDGGATWGALVKVADSNAHSYWRIAQNGDDRIDFAYTDEHPFYNPGSLYHFYYEGGAYFETDGGSAGSLPLDISDMTLVYDGSSVRSWVWDLAINGGSPVIAFAAFPSTSDHRYRYATWSGSAWTTQQIVAAGGHIYGNTDEEYYSGGVVIDRNDPTVVYLSREVSGQWEMFAYRTTDGGATWTSRALTSGSADKQIRPAPVYNADPRLRVMWMAGDYSTYVDWDTGTRGGR